MWFIIFWSICGALSFCFTLSKCKKEYGDDFRNDDISMKAAIFGPISLLVIIIDGDYKYGIKFWKYK